MKSTTSYLLSLTLAVIGLGLWGCILFLENNFPSLANEEGKLHFSLNANTPHVASGQLVSVEFGKSYSWKTEVKVIGNSGEFGFYIDEYDANSEWVSGQWKGALYGKTQKTLNYKYSPTSILVTYAAPQYYLTKESNFEVFLDSNSIAEK